MAIILTVLAVLAILLVNELWWRIRHPHGELSRKLVHIVVGSFVAFWPFYLSWTAIITLSVLFFIVVFISKSLNLFQAIHTVQRPTWGELCFALAVGGVALLTHDKWIYMTAILQMSLADGLAAIIGSRYGNRMKYSIFGHTKSLLGSTTFFVISFGLLVLYGALSGAGYKADYFAMALIVTGFENVSIFGLDNLVVPVVIALFLR